MSSQLTGVSPGLLGGCSVETQCNKHDPKNLPGVVRSHMFALSVSGPNI